LLLAVWTLGGEATAAGKPPFSAQINGRVFRATARNAQAVFVVDVVELVAHTQRGHFSRAVAFACPALNLATATLPVTLSSCNGTYQEVKVSRHPSVKVWATGDGLEITVESFDGSRIKGTFSGTFETPGQPGGPAAVRNGKFNLAVSAS
jgi:hypothetical protein